MARYLLERRNYFSIENKRVKPKAFMPARDLKLSVYRVEGLTDQELWEIGENSVAQPSGRTLHGSAEILASRVLEKDLNIDPDDIPPRHANVIGWPQEKHEQKSVAQELAAVAVLKLRP
ncbi:MAG: hypothetical protein SVS15_02120 [Thermodesulfobacteriota bacterium]|nr:hypothetical protein [Thermodesulfobacteriota bacterium]